MKNKLLKTINARSIAMTGLMMALTIVATIAILIPIPATEGFVNAGDSIILITAYFFGGVPAVIAGGIGSMLADLIAGYAHWAPFTLLIKGLEGAVCGLLMWLFVKKLGAKFAKLKILGIVISCIISTLFMVLGYFIVEVFMYGPAPAAASSLFNLLQAAISTIIACIVIISLRKVKFSFHKKPITVEDKLDVTGTTENLEIDEKNNSDVELDGNSAQNIEEQKCISEKNAEEQNANKPN